MAMICHRKNKCNGCSSYRKDLEEDRMACWALEDGQKISDIILSVWEANYDEYRIDELSIWVSFIMGYGFSEVQILEYAAIRGIQYDPADSDPDYPEDAPGALVIKEETIARIKAELKGGK